MAVAAFAVHVALPIFEAAFAARGSQAALPANQAFGNATFITALRNGEAGGLATSLATNQIYLCRITGGTFKARTVIVNRCVAKPP